MAALLLTSKTPHEQAIEEKANEDKYMLTNKSSIEGREIRNFKAEKCQSTEPGTGYYDAWAARSLL